MARRFAPDSFHALRRKAEEMLRESPDRIPDIPRADIHKLLHELSLYQVELEMQNDELRRSQAAIEESRERYTDLYDFAPVGYMTLDEKGVIVELNLTAAGLLGVERNHLLNRTFLARIDPDSREAFYLHQRRVLRSTRKEACELVLKRKDGSLFDAQIESVAVHGNDERSMRTVLIDITERKRAEEAFRRQAELLELSHEAILMRDMNHRVIYWSKGAEATYGWTKAEALGKNIDTLLRAPLPLPYKEYKTALVEKGHWDGELVHTRKDGSRVTVLSRHALQRDEKGTPIGILEINVDVTTERRLEEQLRQAQKMEAVGTLAGGIAHDFNNILAVILGNVELALDDVREDAVRQNLEQVFKASKRGPDLVKQILTFSRKSDTRRKSVEIVPLVEETFRLLRASIPANIEMSLDSKVTEAAVLVDPSEIQQIVMNLASNAEHAMRDRGGTFTLSIDEKAYLPGQQSPAGEIEPGDYVVITARDTGAGMTAETRKRIFEPFFTTKRTGEGTGMGLAVVYGVVRSVGGGIAVDSTPGKGTTFNVFLPKAGLDTQDRPEAAEPLRGGEERILFVDDEKAVTEANRAILERLGYKVTATTDGRKALELFAKDPRRYDLVITDQAMPQITGIKLAEELLRVRGDIPIILCTGYSHAASPEKAKEAGIRDFLMKPIVRKELSETVRRVLDEVKP
jgi:PAS domain S-box-containing protein